ncbi:MAG TPA: carboxypeptidase-like regulatory domain-containing protein, partial [Thermoanaerobaculia bacterium]|nr:carboxypeptidase-like regulatory domain-containing protein [Thermoanaerobaculia bacterium]
MLHVAVAAAAALLLALSVPAAAQLQTGDLYGVVLDEQGSPLPGVTVTVTGVGAPQIQVTGEDGRFRFLNLYPGTYALRAELQGFSTVEYPDIAINVGSNANL